MVRFEIGKEYYSKFLYTFNNDYYRIIVIGRNGKTLITRDIFNGEETEYQIRTRDGIEYIRPCGKNSPSLTAKDIYSEEEQIRLLNYLDSLRYMGNLDYFN